MLKMNIRQLLGVVAFLTFFSGGAMTQNLSVSYKNKPLEEVLADLKQKTNYNFVYQKQILAGTRSVTANFNDMPLTYILDRVLYNNGLDYEIVKENVIIRPADKENFKKVVSGRVVDIQNIPMPGVNVRVKDTGTGVATGINGEFSIPVEGSHPVLVFSFIGMHDKELRITRETQNPVVVEMLENATMMEEVIVTGYQNLKRESATGAYQLITAKEMDNRYTTDIVSSLEGKIPGLVSYNNGLKSGEDALTIRGVGSFQAKTSPLIVVDGLPIEGSLETVNRYDIESITVLKDASAASIYGARASNGVIVITTKRARQEKLSIDVSADLTVSEKQCYGNHEWANASELLELERYNFDYVVGNEDAYQTLYGQYSSQREKLSPIMQLMMDRHTGRISTDAYNAQIAEWKQNDYRKEWQDVMQRKQIVHQYNVAMRSMGKYLNSSIVINYKGDNTGMTRQHDNALNMSYKGDVELVDDLLTLSVGLNLIRENSKTHADYFGFKGMHAFAPYLSMYNADGTPAAMKAEVDLNEPALKNPALGLKSEEYNLLDEARRNFTKANRTNLRSFVHASLDILPVLNLNARFQYEDITYKSERYLEKESYDMRHLYNLFTSGGVHYIPDGGMLNIDTENGAYYTFRTQANYGQEFNEKHAVEAAAGFEYRETKTRSTHTLLLGYDDQTQSNLTNMVNLKDLRDLQDSDLGVNYSPVGSSPVDDLSGNGAGFRTSEVLHRFYSLYFTGGYTYGRRYSASFSWRVDKTDLFGADPEFRGRPLWSAGLSWNLNNEAFMKPCTWLDVLKLRVSYGLTGNIDSSVSSFLTASLGVNGITGNKQGTLNTPPNDQLRWEKTASWNTGMDFSFFSNRLRGSLDWYRKYSSDLLTVTDLDPTTGWSSLTINNGEALNTGIELALNGEILQAEDRRSLGISASLNFAYNKNEVKAIEHEEPDGFGSMRALHEGRPVNSLYSWRFAGYMTDALGYQQRGWYKADGSVCTSDVGGPEFTPDDVVFSGSLDPKYVGSFTPHITWNGFSLSAMCSFYGGHKMRARTSDYETVGSAMGYAGDVVVRGLLNYWKSENKDAWRANGYLGMTGVENQYSTEYMDCTVVPADYLKVRNIVLAYDFSRTLCRRLGMSAMRLRFQMNNVATWARNKWNIDPETVDPFSGATLDKTPRSYTVSLNINF